MYEIIISRGAIILPSTNIKITGSATQETSLEARDHRIMDVTLNSTCVAFNISLVRVYVLYSPKINMEICFCIFQSGK